MDFLKEARGYLSDKAYKYLFAYETGEPVRFLIPAEDDLGWATFGDRLEGKPEQAPVLRRDLKKSGFVISPHDLDMQIKLWDPEAPRDGELKAWLKSVESDVETDSVIGKPISLAMHRLMETPPLPFPYEHSSFNMEYLVMEKKLDLVDASQGIDIFRKSRVTSNCFFIAYRGFEIFHKINESVISSDVERIQYISPTEPGFLHALIWLSDGGNSAPTTGRSVIKVVFDFNAKTVVYKLHLSRLNNKHRLEELIAESFPYLPVKPSSQDKHNIRGYFFVPGFPINPALFHQLVMDIDLSYFLFADESGNALARKGNPAKLFFRRMKQEASESEKRKTLAFLLTSRRVTDETRAIEGLGQDDVYLRVDVKRARSQRDIILLIGLLKLYLQTYYAMQPELIKFYAEYGITMKPMLPEEPRGASLIPVESRGVRQLINAYPSAFRSGSDGYARFIQGVNQPTVIYPGDDIKDGKVLLPDGRRVEVHTFPPPGMDPVDDEEQPVMLACINKDLPAYVWRPNKTSSAEFYRCIPGCARKGATLEECLDRDLDGMKGTARRPQATGRLSGIDEISVLPVVVGRLLGGNFFRLGVISSDASGFLHAVLSGINYEGYRERDYLGRVELVESFRMSLSKEILKPKVFALCNQSLSTLDPAEASALLKDFNFYMDSKLWIELVSRKTETQISVLTPAGLEFPDFEKFYSPPPSRYESVVVLYKTSGSTGDSRINPHYEVVVKNTTRESVFGRDIQDRLETIVVETYRSNPPWRDVLQEVESWLGRAAVSQMVDDYGKAVAFKVGTFVVHVPPTAPAELKTEDLSRVRTTFKSLPPGYVAGTYCGGLLQGVWYEGDYFIPVVGVKAGGTIPSRPGPGSYLMTSKSEVQEGMGFAQYKTLASVYFQVIYWLYKVCCTQYMFEKYLDRYQNLDQMYEDKYFIDRKLRKAHDRVIDTMDGLVVPDDSPERKFMDVTRLNSTLIQTSSPQEAIQYLQSQNVGLIRGGKVVIPGKKFYEKCMRLMVKEPGKMISGNTYLTGFPALPEDFVQEKHELILIGQTNFVEWYEGLTKRQSSLLSLIPRMDKDILFGTFMEDPMLFEFSGQVWMFQILPNKRLGTVLKNGLSVLNDGINLGSDLTFWDVIPPVEDFPVVWFELEDDTMVEVGRTAKALRKPYNKTIGVLRTKDHYNYYSVFPMSMVTGKN